MIKRSNSEYVNDFERYLLTERRISTNTFDAYKRDLEKLLLYFLQHKLSFETLAIDDLKVFLKVIKSEGLVACSMARKISCLKTFFTFLHDKYGMQDFGKLLLIPKLEKKLPHFLQEDDIEKLLLASHNEKTEAGTRNRIMLYLLYASGMRISELVNATISGLNFSQKHITIMGKGSKQRIIPLPEPIIELLKHYLETTFLRLTVKQGTCYTTNILFPTFYGGVLRAVTRQSFWIYLKELVIKAGLPSFIAPHHLRHSLATHLLKRGVNLRSLQLLLGHEKLNTVQIYTHVETSHLRKMYDKKHPRS